MMSEAMVPVNVSPCCVVALSRVCVMRMGMVVPGVRVTLRKAGGGGGGGSFSAGCGGGAAAACGAGTSCGGDWRTMGAAFDLVGAEGCLGFDTTGAGGAADDGGVASAVT